MRRHLSAIDHATLKRDLRRRIACERTLRLADTIIDGSNPQGPVHIHYGSAPVRIAGSPACPIVDRPCRARRYLASARCPLYPSSALALMAPSGSLAGPVTPLRFARRLLEHQPWELPVRLPQRERHRQSEQQYRIPGGRTSSIRPSRRVYGRGGSARGRSGPVMMRKHRPES